MTASFYNKSEHGAYTPFPKLSPYAKLSEERLKNPKFSFRKALDFAKAQRDLNQLKSWADIGCANGEFIYYLLNHVPSLDYTGYDITPEFVEVAGELLKEHKNVEILLDDALKVSKTDAKYDVVTCLGTFPIFPEPEEFLNALMDMVKPGGLLIADGCFNQYDISTIVKFRDDSGSAEGLWRCDFNLHSQKWISSMLAKRDDVASHHYEHPRMDMEIPRKPDAPHINVWTEKAADGTYDIMNGMLRTFNPSFLIVEKSA